MKLHVFLLSLGVVWKKPEKTYHGQAYSREMPLLFIGGMPRSGTTLMRSMMGKTRKIRQSDSLFR